MVSTLRRGSAPPPDAYQRPAPGASRPVIDWPPLSAHQRAVIAAAFRTQRVAA